MRIRSVQEVMQEMRECLDERRHYMDCANLHRGKGYWSWGDPSYVPKINECTDHMRNLYLELNRIKIREWEVRAGIYK